MSESVVLITGADNGIGYFLTKALLDDGYWVAGLDLAISNLSQLQADHPAQLLACRCDITADAQVADAVETVLRQWGRIDIVVNNACLAIFKPLAERTLEETRREFEVNYFGALRVIKAVLPHMKARGAGLIHNVSSGVGITGFPGLCGYTSTKGALEALTRTLSLELARDGIQVNLMHPPLTKTRSAEPLGIPAEVMEDPARVGRGLARQIRSTRPVIASDLRTAIYLFFAYRYPQMLGGLFARMTEAAHRKQTEKVSSAI